MNNLFSLKQEFKRSHECQYIFSVTEVVFILIKKKQKTVDIQLFYGFRSSSNRNVCVPLGRAVTLTVDLSAFRGSDFAINGCGCYVNKHQDAISRITERPFISKPSTAACEAVSIYWIHTVFPGSLPPFVLSPR